MLDTIVLTTKAYVPKETLITRWNPPTTFSHDHEGEIKYQVYGYQLGNNAPKLSYTVESNKLRVSIPSLPKYCLGTSAVAIDDSMVPRALSLVEQYVSNAGVQNAPNISEWTAASTDLYYDFQVGEDVANYIPALSPIKVAGYKTVTYGHETVSWRRNSGGRDIKFYDREAKCIDKGEDTVTTHFSEGVLRFEVQTNASDYSRFIGATDIGSIFNSKVILPILQRYLSRLDLENLRITTLRDIERKLTAAYDQRRALAIIAFLQAEARGTNLGLNRSTIYRYRMNLKALGIAPVIGIKRLPPLQIGNIPNTAARLAEIEVYRHKLVVGG